jgi:hypothetical protein
MSCNFEDMVESQEEFLQTALCSQAAVSLQILVGHENHVKDPRGSAVGGS